MPLLEKISRRLVRIRRRGANPALRAGLDRALEQMTEPDAADAQQVLREAARVQAAEYVAAINRILAQARASQS
jgi:hypothetical protein